MSERLIPFNFEAFQADPSRLRYLGRAPARASVACGDCVAALWDNGDDGSIFTPDQFRYLRLAAKTRIVRVRLYESIGRAFAATSEQFPGYINASSHPQGHAWISDPVEIEVTE